MNNIFLFFFVFTLGFLFSCIYDPPLRGKDVFVENQTENYILVSDSLKGNGSFIIYDTFLVNKSRYISCKPNYISPFTKWQNFISEKKTKALKNDSIKQIIFYFIKREDVFRPVEEIRTNNLYDSINLNLDEIERNELNYVFYYGDSIFIRHEFSMSKKTSNE